MAPLNRTLSRQTCITGMDEQIIALYAKGLSNQEIVDMFKELYDADVSTSLITQRVSNR
ncbi:Transposase and inactivated derivatives [[Pasteurella] mairii]|uniref:Transposase and inactivated derivatives n=1 Tax=[Pasteurella] mairii TaxID=757 RepID=A0A379B7G3_9PAST|nr:Transposase and inactivated derivatives [[Pasteurella] mairii]